MTIERQELWCHECRTYVQFDIDLGLNGNHVLECPNCGHEYCRVVVDGQITGDRWESRNAAYDTTYSVTTTTVTTSGTSTFLTTGSSSSYLYGAWMNTQAGN